MQCIDMKKSPILFSGSYKVRYPEDDVRKQYVKKTFGHIPKNKLNQTKHPSEPHVHMRGIQLIPQLVPKQFNTLSTQYRLIEHLREDV